MTRLALVIQNSCLDRFAQNLEATLEQVGQAALLGADIIVFPELNLTGYGTGEKVKKIARAVEPGWGQQLSDAANQWDTVIVAGLAEKDRENRIWATQLVFAPKNTWDMYRKIHLAPQETPLFSAGDQVRLFGAKGLRFGIQLCYDAHFPELSLSMALKGADAILMPHASPRGTPKEKLDSWMRHLTARAFDNGVYVAAVNPCRDNGSGLSFPGVAVVVGPDGLLKSSLLTTDPDILMTDLDLTLLKKIRSHRMRYFLPNRRPDLFPL